MSRKSVLHDPHESQKWAVDNTRVIHKNGILSTDACVCNDNINAAGWRIHQRLFKHPCLIVPIGNVTMRCPDLSV